MSDRDDHQQSSPAALRLLPVATLAILSFAFFVPASFAQVTFEPIADNTIFEGEESNSNGAGDRIFVGRILGTASPPARNRRALVRFDLSSIPAGSTIQNVSLGLTEINVPPSSSTPTVSLHRMLVDWGEGSSSGSGAGAPAVPPDATWLFRITPGTAWGSDGGQAGTDYAPLASASDSDGTIDSTPALVDDVQAWVDGTADNHGWMLIGDESSDGSVRGYGSTDHPVPASRPQLTVTFEAAPTLEIPTTSTMGLLLMAAAMGLLALRLLRR